MDQNNPMPFLMTSKHAAMLRIIQEGQENILYETDEWSQPETLLRNAWESHNYDIWHDLKKNGWIEVSEITIDTWPTQTYYSMTASGREALAHYEGKPDEF